MIMCFSKNNKFIFFCSIRTVSLIFLFSISTFESFITCNMNLLYNSSLVEKIKVKKLKIVKK